MLGEAGGRKWIRQCEPLFSFPSSFCVTNARAGCKTHDSAKLREWWEMTTRGTTRGTTRRTQIEREMERTSTLPNLKEQIKSQTRRWRSLEMVCAPLVGRAHSDTHLGFDRESPTNFEDGEKLCLAGPVPSASTRFYKGRRLLPCILNSAPFLTPSDGATATTAIARMLLYIALLLTRGLDIVQGQQVRT